MHPELVAMVREWTHGMAPDEPLFPRLDKKKTYTMVQKDLERAGIPYETHEGLADFHAAGRHSHITGLVRSGASIMEAKELARHADIRQTAKYTHIGMEDRAKALAGLPAPKSYAFVELSEIRRVSGGALSQELSPDDSDDDPDDDPGNEKTPSGEGVSSSLVTDFQEVSVDVSSGGGGNCTRVPRSIGDGLYVCSRSFDCRPRGPVRQGPLRLIRS
jgi:Phage integrase family